MEETTPAIVPSPAPAKKSINWLIIIILVVLLLCSCVVIGVLLAKNFNLLPQLFTNTTPTPTLGISNTPTSRAITTPTSAKGVITGNLTYPSEFIPVLRICAVDTTTGDETCENTAENDSVYELEVAAGSYYVYVQDPPGYIAYYTKCDSNSNILCNDESWYQEGFACYNNAECKLAFKPMVVSVSAGETSTGINFMQGWYLPCSNAACYNGAEEWQNYFD